MSKIWETVVPVKGMKKWQWGRNSRAWSEVPSGGMWPKGRGLKENADVPPCFSQNNVRRAALSAAPIHRNSCLLFSTTTPSWQLHSNAHNQPSSVSAAPQDGTFSLWRTIVSQGLEGCLATTRL